MPERGITTSRRQRVASGVIGVLVLMLGLHLGTDIAAAYGRMAAAAGKRPVYCTSPKRPKGCITVPPGIKQPAGKDQQGDKRRTPPGAENGGGIGGDDVPATERRANALAWARGLINSTDWYGYCERFAEEAYGTRGRFDTAAIGAKRLQLNRGPVTGAPPGALVYFRAASPNRWYGHVGISAGKGVVISALHTVTKTDVGKSRFWRSLYLGWAYAPDTWPGRIKPLDDRVGEDDLGDIRITSPGVGSPLSGPVDLTAFALKAEGVEFAAYYVDDPLKGNTPSWHPLGKARRSGPNWTLSWNPAGIKDPGDLGLGTVNIAAIALHADGRRSGTKDYRRVAIEQAPATPPATVSPTNPPTPAPTATPTPTPTPTPAPLQQTEPRIELEQGPLGTASVGEVRTGSGAGPAVPANQTVGVSCALYSTSPTANPGGLWYRLLDAPWANAYFAAASSFTGAPHPAVPPCVQQGSLGAATFASPEDTQNPGGIVPPGSVIRVTCRIYAPVISSVSPDGFWYLVASGEQAGRYVAANTFLNGDPAGSAARNTDAHVPQCAETTPAGSTAVGSPVDAAGARSAVPAERVVGVSCRIYAPGAGNADPGALWVRLSDAPWSNDAFTPMSAFRTDLRTQSAVHRPALLLPWCEQVAVTHGVPTFSDPNAVVGPGPNLPFKATVAVSCRLYAPSIPSVEPDGYWYRLTDAPYGDQYFAAANTFFNGDGIGEQANATDLRVPFCEQLRPGTSTATSEDPSSPTASGPVIAPEQVVAVSCRRSGNGGDWYRIGEVPWDDAFYAPAADFLNGDVPGDPASRTTDAAVPLC